MVTNRACHIAIGYRISNGILIGCFAGFVCHWWLTTYSPDAGDFGWALREAAAMKAGLNPYISTSFGMDVLPYPLTAALFAFPLLALPRELAAAIFIGLSSALLGFAVSKRGHRHMLLFLSYPFWAAVFAVQWSPLLTAGALLPWVFPAVIAKPNLGLAIAATKSTGTGLLVCVSAVVFTLVLCPAWPLWWLHQTGGYQSFIPLFGGVGIVLALALQWRSDEHAQLLLAMALVPQRWYYDALPLWLIPTTTTELLGASLLSWGGLFLTPVPRTIHQVATIYTAVNYLPMLLILAARHASKTSFQPGPSPLPQWSPGMPDR